MICFISDRLLYTRCLVNEHAAKEVFERFALHSALVILFEVCAMIQIHIFKLLMKKEGGIIRGVKMYTCTSTSTLM